MGLVAASLQRRIAAIGVGTLVAGVLGVGILAPVAQAAPAPDIDTSFIGNVAGNSVTGIGSGVGRVAVQSDGKILLTVGYDTTLNAAGTRGIARLNADGTPDTAFNTNIVNANLGISVATSIMELSNGQILVGTGDDISSPPVFKLLLLEADGQVAANQPTWQPPSTVNFWDMFNINVIRELSDGKVLIGGAFPDQLVRLELSSGIWVEDATFVGKAALEQNSVQDLVVLNDGSIVVAGSMRNSQTASTSAQTCSSVIMLNADGTLNDAWCASFGSTAPNLHTIYSVALDASGAIIAGGQAAQTDVPVNRIVTSGSTATLDMAFAANINAELPNESTTTFAILVQSDGDILVGSEWRCCNAAVLGGLRRFHADGSFDVNFDSFNQTNFDATVKAIAVINGQVIAGGSFTLVAPNNSFGGGIVRFQGPLPACTGTTSGSVTTYTITTDCAWETPAGVTTVDVVVVGGGGGGSGSYVDNTSGAVKLFTGAGGGGGAVTVATGVPVSGTFAVTIGAGGAAGAIASAGGAGGSSTFASPTPVTAAGGGGADAPDVSGGTTYGGSSGRIVNGVNAGPFVGGTSSGIYDVAPGVSGYSFVAGGGGAGALGDPTQVGTNGSTPTHINGNVNATKVTASGLAGEGEDGYKPIEGLFSVNIPNAYPNYGPGGGGGSAYSNTISGYGGKGNTFIPSCPWCGFTIYGGNGGRESTSGTAGVDNTGGGGGGAGISGAASGTAVAKAGYAGGSGIVIVKYSSAPPPVAPTFTAESPSTTGTVNSVYSSYTFLASGTTPITFTKDSGSLPPGLTLSAGGVLSGTPTAAGSYTFTVKAVNGTTPDATTASITITIDTTPGPGTRPNAPKQPVLIAGDGKLTVTVERGIGGGTPTRFTATATPSGATCQVTSATGGTCVISGLTNGTLYTVTAIATNGSGSSDPSVVSQQARPGAPVVPEPEPLPNPLPAGGSLLLVNGQPQRVDVAPKDDDTGLTITGDGFKMNLDGLNSAGQPMNLGPDGVLILGQEREVLTSGSGFMPASDVKLFVDPGIRARAKGAVKPIYIGVLRTDASGSFAGTKALPTGISPGVHDLQAVGVTKGNLSRAMTLGVRVAAPPGVVRQLMATVTTTVTLDWKAPSYRGHSQITGYQVRYRLLGIGRWTLAPASTATAATLGMPLTGCTYVAQVRALNQVGAGKWKSTTFVAATGARSRPAGDIVCGVVA